jgi:hypothetical protein
MDPLHQYHVDETFGHHVTQNHLVVGLAQHALRNITHHEHVLKTITPRQSHSNDFVPQQYTDTKHIQAILG